MKIIKYPNEYNMDDDLENKVIDSCSVCPFCGEKKQFHVNHEDRSFEGVLTYPARQVEVRAGLIRTKLMKVVSATCFTCGAKWESHPY